MEREKVMDAFFEFVDSNKASLPYMWFPMTIFRRFKSDPYLDDIENENEKRFIPSEFELHISAQDPEHWSQGGAYFVLFKGDTPLHAKSIEQFFRGSVWMNDSLPINTLELENWFVELLDIMFVKA
jgi:hypothetical protein